MVCAFLQVNVLAILGSLCLGTFLCCGEHGSFFLKLRKTQRFSSSSYTEKNAKKVHDYCSWTPVQNSLGKGSDLNEGRGEGELQQPEEEAEEEWEGRGRSEHRVPYPDHWSERREQHWTVDDIKNSECNMGRVSLGKREDLDIWVKTKMSTEWQLITNTRNVMKQQMEQRWNKSFSTRRENRFRHFYEKF